MKPCLLLVLPALFLSACVVVDTTGGGGSAAPAMSRGSLEKTVGPGMVTISENGNTVSVIRTAAPNIEAAEFMGPDQAQIAIKSRGAHGPASCELFDTRTGQLRDKVLAYAVQNGQPAWAASFAE